MSNPEYVHTEQPTSFEESHQVILLPDRWYFFTESRNIWPLCRWQTQINLAYTMPGGVVGTMRTDTTSFSMEPISSPVYLVWDRFPHSLFADTSDDSQLEIQLNGMDIAPLDEPQGFPADSMVFLLSDYLYLGENTIILKSCSSTRPPLVGQDALRLEGDFIIRELANTPVLAIPPLEIQTGSWCDQGYPFYQGYGVYRQEIVLAEPVLEHGLFLRMDDLADVAELSVNGRVLGSLHQPPWQWDVTGTLQPGKNVLQLRVDNTQYNTIPYREKASGLLGPVILEVI
jgi:hypothetical protein